ncbi:MAG: glycosyltransferase family 2 protein [Anaerolineae bacterium]|nr:glycosyltransferase family 2 protein [Anaerolineae bacterium]
MVDLSVIIVNWNTRELLAICLESVASSANLEIAAEATRNTAAPENFTAETWVVDNVSTDGSAQMVQKCFPWVNLIENRQNVGFAGANNQAICQSTGHYVLFLNPDTEVKPDALETLIRFLEKHPQAGAVGPHTLNGDGTLQTSCYPVPTLARELWRLFHLDALHAYGTYSMKTWVLDQPRQVDALLGACLLVRREVLDQIGLLDEQYFIYSEEIDLCYRIQKAGWKLYWVPEAKIIHYGGQSTQQVRTKMFLQLYRSKLLFFRKHYGWLAAQIYKLIILFAALGRILVSPVAWLGNSDRRKKQRDLAIAYLRLVKALPGL